MILTLQEWLHRRPATPEESCIVGAGPAGIELALALARGGRRVLVLEAGARTIDPRDQREDDLPLTGHPFLGGNHDFRAGMTGPAARAVRIRAFGGASTVWSGKWKLPDRIDFASRPWLTPHGWPIARSEIAQHLDDVLRDHGLPGAFLEPEPVREVPALVTTFHHEQHPPLDFGARHGAALEASKHITVVLGAHAVELLPAPGGARVESIAVKGRGGIATRVPAERIVLAAGGIETARLLLLSTRFGRTGPGNRHGHVGRTFMEHPKARLGVFHPNRTAAWAGLLGARRRARRRVATRWTLSPERQQALGIANHAVGLVPTGPRPRWYARWWREPPPHELFVFMEQLPNPESRVSLGLEHDELGTPKARVHWDFLPADAAGLRIFAEELGRIVAPRFGRLEIDESALRPAGWSAGSHPMGTARMAAAPEDGVVDTDGRVFGVDNLYVTGSAVFPVGGNANPTLLLLALGRRLARHLARSGP